MYNYLGVHQYGLDIDNVIEFMQYQERVKNNVAVVKHTPPPHFWLESNHTILRRSRTV